MRISDWSSNVFSSDLPLDASENGVMTTVYGSPAPEAAEMTEGPEIEGIISARSDDRLQVTAADGTHTIIAVDETTRIKASGGFLGLSRSKLGAESLLNGLPVSVETLQWDGGLRSEEHTSELQSLMRLSYAVFC